MEFDRIDLGDGRYTMMAADGSLIAFYNRPVPETVEALAGGHISIVTGPTRMIDPRKLEPIRIVRCGPLDDEKKPVRHLNGDERSRRWTTPVVHGVYLYSTGHGRPEIVLTSGGGAGHEFMVLDQLDAHEGFLEMAITLSETAVWDIVHALFGTYRKANEEGRQFVRQAFVDGRLKKRKRRGQDSYTVTIEPAPRG